MWALAGTTTTDPTWYAVVGAVGIGTVLSAAITAVSLIYQNRRNGQREDRRRAEDSLERQRDRDAEATMRGLERREVLDDHWRDERRAAHSAFLSSLNEGHQYLLKSAGEAIHPPESDDDDPDHHGFVTRLQPQMMARLGGLMSEMTMICSDEASNAGSRAYLTLMELNKRLLDLSGFKVTAEDREAFWDSATETLDSIRAYRECIRRDLGVTDKPRDAETPH